MYTTGEIRYVIDNRYGEESRKHGSKITVVITIGSWGRIAAISFVYTPLQCSCVTDIPIYQFSTVAQRNAPQIHFATVHQCSSRCRDKGTATYCNAGVDMLLKSFVDTPLHLRCGDLHRSYFRLCSDYCITAQCSKVNLRYSALR